MSSPLAKKKYNFFQKQHIKLHRKISHKKRTTAIAWKINDILPKDKIKCLDIGCGDRKISGILQWLSPESNWFFCDIYPTPPTWNNYLQIVNGQIPFEDKSIDYGIIIDVLHHMTESEQIKLLKEASRVCKKLIIKDHFVDDTSKIKRKILLTMDWFGNSPYGVKIPNENDYFSKNTFLELCKKTGLSLQHIEYSLNIYSFPFISNMLNSMQCIGLFKT